MHVATWKALNYTNYKCLHSMKRTPMSDSRNGAGKKEEEANKEKHVFV